MLREQTVSTRRAVIIVVIVCGVAVGMCGLFVVLRLTRPADGLMIEGYAQVDGHIGVELYVMQRYPLPIGLEADDVIMAIEDRSIEELGRDLFDPGDWGQSSVGPDRPIAYRVMRDGQTLVVMLTLGVHPHHNLFEYWGVAVFALVYLGAGVFVFLKRPTEPVAGALLLSAGGEFVFNLAGTFPLQVSDLDGSAHVLVCAADDHGQHLPGLRRANSFCAGLSAPAAHHRRTPVDHAAGVRQPVGLLHGLSGDRIRPLFGGDGLVCRGLVERIQSDFAIDVDCAAGHCDLALRHAARRGRATTTGRSAVGRVALSPWCRCCSTACRKPSGCRRFSITTCGPCYIRCSQFCWPSRFCAIGCGASK